MKMLQEYEDHAEGHDGGDIKSYDIEIQGYLQIKANRTFFTSKYFVTEGHYLKYWIDKNSYEIDDKESDSYDITDIAEIEKLPNKIICLQFMNGKYKIQLKSGSDEQRNEWVEILNAKKSLYSVDELLKDMNSSRLSFSTNTFKSLMVLKEKDQNKWMLAHLDSQFSLSNNVNNNNVSNIIIKAAKSSLSEFIETCRECASEISTRNPRKTVLCRDYIHRYANTIKGRITLELQCLPGVPEKKFDHMGIESICECIEFVNILDSLTEFKFLPKNMLSDMRANIFNSGELLSALLNIGITRIDAFFGTLSDLDPVLRANKLEEIDFVISETLSSVHLKDSHKTYENQIILKMLTTQVLAFVDHLNALSFKDCDESSLIFYIHSCDNTSKKFQGCLLDTVGNKLVYRNSAALQSISLSNHQKDLFIHLPSSLTDAVSSCCNETSFKICKKIVQNIQPTIDSILTSFFNEKSNDWIGGDSCRALLQRINQWLMNILKILSSKFSRTIELETGKMLIKLYLNQYIKYSMNPKRRVRYSTKGIFQIDQDLTNLKNWIKSKWNEYSSNDRISRNAPSREVKPNSFDIYEECFLIDTTIDFLKCSDNNALNCFSNALLVFGIPYSLHLYDLLRFLLKTRGDISHSTRKAILGLCTEFLSQLHEAAASDPSLLCGKLSYLSKQSSTRSAHREFVQLLEEIFPNAGYSHCSGKKWKLQLLSNPLPVRLSISMLVTSTFEEARKDREDIYKKINANPNGNSHIAPSGRHSLPEENSEKCPDNDIEHKKESNLEESLESRSPRHSIPISFDDIHAEDEDLDESSLNSSLILLQRNSKQQFDTKSPPQDEPSILLSHQQSKGGATVDETRSILEAMKSPSITNPTKKEVDEPKIDSIKPKELTTTNFSSDSLNDNTDSIQDAHENSPKYSPIIYHSATLVSPDRLNDPNDQYTFVENVEVTAFVSPEPQVNLQAKPSKPPKPNKPPKPDKRRSAPEINSSNTNSQLKSNISLESKSSQISSIAVPPPPPPPLSSTLNSNSIAIDSKNDQSNNLLPSKRASAPYLSDKSKSGKVQAPSPPPRPRPPPKNLASKITSLHSQESEKSPSEDSNSNSIEENSAKADDLTDQEMKDGLKKLLMQAQSKLNI